MSSRRARLITVHALRDHLGFFQAEIGIRGLIVTGVETCVFFFSSRRRHTRSDRDWSSDVCSSDLVLLLHGHAKVADFGLARQQEQLMSSMSFAGTPVYMAPEVWGGERSEERRVGKEGRSRWSPYH